MESQEFVGAPVTILSDELQDKFKTLDTQLGSLISSYFERFNEAQFPAMVSSESEIIGRLQELTEHCKLLKNLSW
ncbi:hypothetical protein LOSG293_160200 [Secundilactobacillus oryzae JCM 18671]|uniref:Uncharacterized protein n=1 Tax=Secundilactobacillus oryzae JCM 18671 TaxID=1291743 RepID=A0A081BIV9_9LACO|nr:hypothetical protein LOSG293_160200 [Secundilactobacillus oryzae JCM 18671]